MHSISRIIRMVKEEDHRIWWSPLMTKQLEHLNHFFFKEPGKWFVCLFFLSQVLLNIYVTFDVLMCSYCCQKNFPTSAIKLYCVMLCILKR